MSDRPTTREEALELALDWAEGRRSHTNLMLGASGPESRAQVLAAIAQADAAEAAKWAALAAVLPNEIGRPVREEAETPLPSMPGMLRAFHAMIRTLADLLGMDRTALKIRVLEEESLRLGRPPMVSSRDLDEVEMGAVLDRLSAQIAAAGKHDEGPLEADLAFEKGPYSRGLRPNSHATDQSGGVSSMAEFPGGPWLVFAYESHYPHGGWGDFVSAHATPPAAEAGAEAARAYVEPPVPLGGRGGYLSHEGTWLHYDYVQIVDVAAGKVTRSWTLDRRTWNVKVGSRGASGFGVWDEDELEDGDG